MTYLKLLHQLSIKEIRQELRDRGLKSLGSRETLTARLRQALINEEEDPETYTFEIELGIVEFIGKIQDFLDTFDEQLNMSRNIKLNKVDEIVLQVKGQIDQSDKIVSQAKGGINSLGKEQLPGQDCGCTNSGDGGAGDWSAVCDCVVGKSGGDDFHGEKRDNDCCDDFNGICTH
ncbi:uncharacterized protein LOC129928531 [Biomphalaria glabrata]|uniref:Uncharacterized protein LOC129928531 n=1 Tax=Biomphalaria glabrata TaxID=6526 RepID=A0A9W3BI79_BIOGL|nr:uncharacterized protein LOC129928531 [Biomphalaria glabrata]